MNTTDKLCRTLAAINLQNIKNTSEEMKIEVSRGEMNGMQSGFACGLHMLAQALKNYPLRNLDLGELAESTARHLLETQQNVLRL